MWFTISKSSPLRRTVTEARGRSVCLGRNMIPLSSTFPSLPTATPSNSTDCPTKSICSICGHCFKNAFAVSAKKPSIVEYSTVPPCNSMKFLIVSVATRSVLSPSR